MDARTLETMIEPLLEQEGAELVDLRYAKEGPRWILRVFIDKPSGVSIDDCAYFSDRIGGLIDAGAAIERSYVLEVSSPGLDRVIKKDKDFERFSGRPVRLRLKAPEQGQRNFQGVLRGLQEGQVSLDMAGSVRRFDRGLVDEVRLDYAAEADL